MKPILVLLLLFVPVLPALGDVTEGASAQWARRLGTGSANAVVVHDGVAYAGGGNTTGEIHAFTPGGDLLWSVRVDHRVEDLALGENGALFVIGGLGVVSISRHDIADGAHRWTRRFGRGLNEDEAGRGRGIAVDPGGQLIVVGSMNRALQLDDVRIQADNPYADVLVAKLRPEDGAVVWARSFGRPTGNDYGGDIGSDAAGNIYLIAAGGLEPDEGRDGPAMLMSLDPTGEMRWVTTIDHAGGAASQDLHVQPDGTTTFAGSQVKPPGIGHPAAPHTHNAFVARYSSNGKPVWSLEFQSPGVGWAGALAPAPDLGTWVVGSFSGTLTGHDVPLLSATDDFDGFLVHVDADGKVTHQQLIHGHDADWIHAVAADDSAVHIAGCYRGDLRWNDEVLATPAHSATLDNGFLIRVLVESL
jgi:hypothetical protein